MPAVMRKPQTLAEKLKQKGLAKLLFPKASKIITNVIQFGPRVVVRSATQLLSANPLTRIVSVTSLTFIDIYLLYTKKISHHQFLINLTYSISMFFGSTLGWYVGARVASQLAVDAVLAFVISIVFLLIGNQLADRGTRLVVSRVATTDCQRGLAEINKMCPPDKHIEVTKDQCLEVFRQYGDEQRRCIHAIIAEAEPT